MEVCLKSTASILSRPSTSIMANRCRAEAPPPSAKPPPRCARHSCSKNMGKCGMDVSELFPHVGECADDICWIRSVYTDIPNHEPAMLMMNTGHSQVGRPSMGSWLTYGLGTENRNLPGYVVLCPDVPTTVGPPLWNSAFLTPQLKGQY